MKSIGAELSKSIKEQLWIHLEYENRHGETTYFWAAIKDIHPKSKKLVVDMFNSKYYGTKRNTILEATLSFDQIKNATILEETTYDTPDQLYDTIDEHIHHLEWLGYDQFDHKVLTYLKRAFDMDNTPYQLEGNLIDGIDEEKLLKEEKITLKGIQIDQITERILKEKNHQSKSETAYTIKSLALNDLSIVTSKGTFIIAYYPVKFNPKGMTLSISKDVVINQVFLTEGFPRNLKHYLDIDPDQFISSYQDNKKVYRAYIEENLKQNEFLNEKPFMMEIARDITVNLRHDYDAIVNLHKNQKMNTPLIAFFGNMNQRLKKRTERSVVVLDKRVNIDQLRVIHNALKQYITYVQGPPGTGKTQTILNVLISAFFNDDTVLVSSSNNHPLDGIMNKMNDLKYKGMRIPFPILRLGNKDYMIEALKTIRTQFETCKNLTVYEDALNMSHEKKTENVEALNKLLDQYEERLEIEEKLEVLKTFKETAGSFHSSIIVSDEIEKLKKKLNALPKVSNDEALKKVEGADRRFSTWLNFMSVERIQRLGEKRYENLWEIINMDDEEAQYKAFKEYLRDKKNFKGLQRVFPFIISTLHSVPKLGPAESNFDLAVIDEASQANIAISLPALLRGDRLLLVGDPNQLAPVVTIDPGINEALRKSHRIRNTYDFRTNSIMKTMQTVDPISKFVLLRYHYRSQKPIIAFSNKKYYGEALIIKTEDLNNKALKFYDVKNNEDDATYHVAKEEAEAIKGIVKKYLGKSIGVITPFRKQKDAITEILGRDNKDAVDIGTIHSFQGDEKDIVIISPAIKKTTKKKTFDWIKNNRELLNVGTTR
ncbi:MAG: AAA domain-containing protein, partial [Candidatus Izemoplasmataceae bacterium]